MMHMTVGEAAKVVKGTILYQGQIIEPSHPAAEALITSIILDSRKAICGSLFVPVIGEKVDAHRFIPQVFSAGSTASLSMEDIKGSIDGLIIRVADTETALMTIASELRKHIPQPIIGVTGSVGKTTTREMIALALKGGKKVYATAGNQNSQLGVPLTLAAFDDSAEIGVLEMGISFPGEMHHLADMVRPDMAVFTNIGITHLENLKTRENILKEKMGICEYMKAGSAVILNKDNDLLSSCSIPEGLKAYYYGSTPDCDAYYTDLCFSGGRMNCTAHIAGTDVKVSLKVYDQHLILNALAALLAASLNGVDPADAAASLNQYKGFAHRQQIIEAGDVIIIDDSYNASPASMKSALEVLFKIECRGKRIAVLADMKELGENEALEHKTIGQYIADLGIVDQLLVLGPLGAVILKNAGDIQCKAFTDRNALDAYLADIVKPGDAVLFKGSNSMKLFDSAENLIQTFR